MTHSSPISDLTGHLQDSQHREEPVGYAAKRTPEHTLPETGRSQSWGERHTELSAQFFLPNVTFLPIMKNRGMNKAGTK